jgi:methyl-accepting chemotaxis protein
MNKLSLKMKLGVGFGALLVLLALMGYLSYSSAKHSTVLSSQVESAVAMKDASVDSSQAMWRGLASCRAFLLTGNEEFVREYQDSRRQTADALDRLSKMQLDDQEKKLYSRLPRLFDELGAKQEKVIELRRNGKEREAGQLLFSAEAQEIRTALATTLKEFDEKQDKDLQESSGEQKALESRAETMALVLAGCGILFGLFVAVLIARSITGVIGRMVALIQEIAANNLAIEDVEITSQDEIGKAGSALNSMKNNLRTIMQSIAGTAEHVASASEEISASATQTANGSETQKDQVHQIATAMQEMSSTVHEVSENCNKAAESAHKASETAREGGAIVDDTLTLMRSIADSVRETAKSVQQLGTRSDQIGKIVGVIDDIADQTNLLALNAAIEAARAGEQGRGFAVVADEVRKLAERTTKATKEIAEMIQSVQSETRGAVEKMQSGTQQVEKGVEVTAKAGDSLKQIIGQAEHVGEMVTHIATAATEQSSATEQVNANMEQINKLVAESAEGAQQSATACEQLSSLALELQNLVSRFKLGQQTAGGATRVSAAYRPPRRVAADPVRARTVLALAPKPPMERTLQHAGHDLDGE